MTHDEEQIRDLVRAWMDATRSGDVDTVVGLMTDDVVFLRPGSAPMHKAEFVAAAKAQAQHRAPTFDGRSEVQEVLVSGDLACIWTHLTVVATPPDGGPKVQRAGHTLSVLRKESGRWRLARDANLLSPAPRPG
jgi:uncharacterized protein (TIGR02246 family)